MMVMAELNAPDIQLASKTAHEQALAWFAHLQDSKVSQSDKAAFAEWLAASENHLNAYKRVERFWQSPALHQAASQVSMPLPLPSGLKPHPKKQHFAAAACLLLLGGWLIATSGFLLHWQADYVTATGEQRRIALEDGSVLVLNTGSAAALAYDRGQRVIRLLQGEAYFEVKPDKTRPFVVATGQGKVQVVGTRFNVNTHTATSVDVESGSVACSGQQGGFVRLSAGQHTVITEDAVSPATASEPGQAFAWLKGRLIFQDRPLAEVIAELGRYHHGAILIANTKLAQTRITGNYKLEDTGALILTLAEIAGARTVSLTPYLTLVKL
jgi:transmembrane sensor